MLKFVNKLCGPLETLQVSNMQKQGLQIALMTSDIADDSPARRDNVHIGAIKGIIKVPSFQSTSCRKFFFCLNLWQTL